MGEHTPTRNWESHSFLGLWKTAMGNQWPKWLSLRSIPLFVLGFEDLLLQFGANVCKGFRIEHLQLKRCANRRGQLARNFPRKGLRHHVHGFHQPKHLSPSALPLVSPLHAPMLHVWTVYQSSTFMYSKHDPVLQVNATCLGRVGKLREFTNLTGMWYSFFFWEVPLQINMFKRRCDDVVIIYFVFPFNTRSKNGHPSIYCFF